MRPEDLRHTHRAPRAEVVTEAIGVAAFFDVVHLLEDGRVKFAQHSFPVGVLVRAREETVREFDEPVKNRNVDTDRLGEVRTLYFDGDFLAGRESRAINLAK